MKKNIYDGKNKFKDESNPHENIKKFDEYIKKRFEIISCASIGFGNDDMEMYNLRSESGLPLALVTYLSGVPGEDIQIFALGSARAIEEEAEILGEIEKKCLE